MTPTSASNLDNRGVREKSVAADSAMPTTVLKPKIKRRFEDTNFDDRGIRLLCPEDISKNEMIPTTATDGSARMVADYEIFREIRGAYDMAKCGDQTRAAISKTGFAERWLGCFPLPFAELPPGKRSEITTMIPEDAVIPLNDHELADWKAIYREKLGPIAGRVWDLTFHQFAIMWGRVPRTQIKKYVRQHLEVILKQAPKLRRKTCAGRSPGDEISQLRAWRARRAGLNHKNYGDVLKKFGLLVEEDRKDSNVCHYSDPSAFSKACDSAEKRILHTAAGFR